MVESHALIVIGRRGRPAILDWKGGKVYITVHDEYYRRTLREFKNAVKLAHPDLRGRTHRVKAHPVAGSTITKRLVTRDGVDRGLITYTQQPYAKSTHTRQTAQAGSRPFRQIQRAMARWKRDEARWYAQYGLTPPEWSAGES